MFFRVWFSLFFYVFTNGAGNVVVIAPWRQCNPTDTSVPGPRPKIDKPFIVRYFCNQMVLYQLQQSTLFNHFVQSHEKWPNLLNGVQ